jgi:hypothetical protein
MAKYKMIIIIFGSYLVLQKMKAQEQNGSSQVKNREITIYPLKFMTQLVLMLVNIILLLYLSMSNEN